MKKIFTLSAAAMVAASSFAAQDATLVQGPEDSQIQAVSNNGKYAAGRLGENPVIWNLETGEVVTKVGYEGNLRGVSNDGVGVGYAGDYAIKFNLNGDYEYVDGEPGNVYSTARNISADGTMILGARFDASYRTTPGYWMDGTFHQLPLPDESTLEFELMGCQATGISDDKATILGNMMDGMGADVFVIWTRNAAGEYEFQPIYEPYYEPAFGDKPYYLLAGENISANGQWVSVTVQEASWDMIDYPALYNVATGELKQASGDRLTYGGIATGVSNRGTIVGYTETESMDMIGRQGFIWRGGDDTVEMFDETAAIADLNKQLTNVPCGISADGAHVVGFYADEDALFHSYEIVLPAEEGTGVATIAADLEGVNGIYDLQGRRVNGTPDAGIYIVIENGKSHKVLVK